MFKDNFFGNKTPNIYSFILDPEWMFILIVMFIFRACFLIRTKNEFT